MNHFEKIQTTSTKTFVVLLAFVGSLFFVAFLNTTEAHAADEVSMNLSIVQSGSTNYGYSSGHTSGGGGGGLGGGGGGHVNPDVRWRFTKCDSTANGVCTVKYVHSEQTHKTRQGCTPVYRWQLYTVGSLSVSYESFGTALSVARDTMARYHAGSIDGTSMLAHLWANPRNSANFGRFSWSYNQTDCIPIYTYNTVIEQRTQTCGRGGNNPAYPYAVGVSIRQDNEKIDGRDNWVNGNVSCVYLPANEVPAKEPRGIQGCIWGVTYNFYYSQSRSAIASAGTHIKGPYKPAGLPRPSTSDNGRILNNCIQDSTTGYGATPIDYGYYRLQGDWNIDTYRIYVWPAWTQNAAVAEYRLESTGKSVRSDYYVYSCNPAGSNPVEGPFTHGGLPTTSQRSFEPGSSACSNWYCELNTQTRTAGSDTAGRPVTVMRNGEPVTVNFATIRIISTGPNGSNPTNVTTGSSANIRNVSNIEYRNFVKEGSTPFLNPGSSGSVNSSTQYFRLNNNTGGKENFNTWYSHGNTAAGYQKTIEFNWSSDDNSSPFVLQRDWRITAEFLSPVTNQINGGGTTYRWETDTQACRDRNRNPILSNSNNINVVRSVNK